MGSRIEHRAGFTRPAAEVHAAFIDRAFLDERLRALGGKNAELLEYTANGAEVTFKLRQGVPGEKLPSIVRTVIKGDLIVERTESWRPDGAAFSGSTSATVSAVPGDIKGTFRLVDTAGGSEWSTSGQVKVSIPFVGGKIESVIAEQVTQLLAAEAEFAAEWLAEH
ncbi:hypothetical protein [Alloactinosynnema sp. L-07]|uniref:DUF2505 domain-containing protein n=1 Tax=Alloactinosynnema sp. L-07 TaxID=1653480 RepID=UPI00065F094F|nr:DUF2505 domain-containing protein [Alloactinosynnema sp. L-07]CRK60240.1 hypothetical protein [Alloactinosynnema sp. L-07]